MQITFFINPIHRNYHNAAHIFGLGLQRHGLSLEVASYEQYRDCDLAVMWSHRFHDIIERQRSLDRDYLVLERGYFGSRNHWTSIGFNGLHGRAEFKNEGSPGDRWKHWEDQMQPWSTGGDYALILGQVPLDQATHGMDSEGLYIQTAETMRARGLEVQFRPHPVAPTYRVPGIPTREGSLAGALAQAALTVSINSASSIAAVLAGVPSIVLDKGSMAWPVTAHDLDETPPRPDRTQWAYNLAYTQWSREEIKSGEAWAHLSK